MTPRQRPPRLLVAGLLLVHAGLLLYSARVNFVTIDESSHIPAGLWHWRMGDFRLYCVNPPLPRMLATLPLLAVNIDMDFGSLPARPGARPEWEAGPRFADANADRYLDLLWLARLAGVGWSLLGGWLVCRWASELYGWRAGSVALTLWCFAPNILAHAPLVTPDLPATVAGMAASYVFWHYLRKPSWHLAWFAGLLLGVAVLTKFTWLILYGLWPVLAVACWWRPRMSRAIRVQRALQLLALVAVSLLAINLAYGFSGTGKQLGQYPFVSQLFTGGQRETEGWGNRFRDGFLGPLPVPLPADLVGGIDVQRRDFESNWPFYLGGEWQKGGRWYFYLYAFLLKMPLGTWGLLLGMLGCLLSRRLTACWRKEGCLFAVPIVLLTVVSSQTGLNYFRYALPALPFLFVALSRMGCLLERAQGKGGIVVLGLLLWAVGSSLAVYPHSLSYCNELAGGPRGGHRYLVDSNFDWGQDLLYLRRWLQEHPDVENIELAYHNHIDPRIVGVAFRLPYIAPPLGGGAKEADAECGPRPGYVAVSVHFVRGGTFIAADGRGGWRTIPLHGLSYFRELQPIASAGYSILIYHLSSAEANRVRQQYRSLAQENALRKISPPAEGSIPPGDTIPRSATRRVPSASPPSAIR